MLRIAIQMLLWDKFKYYILISAIAFSTFLITQQLGIFFGLMRVTVSLINNINVPIWVVERNIETVESVKNMRENDLLRVKSVPGVKWAVPYSNTLSQVTTASGKFHIVHLIGVDTASLIGVPPHIILGDVRDLYKEGGVIVDQIGLHLLNEGLEKPLDLGDELVINDHKLRLVGVVDAEPFLDNHPRVYTTYDRAIEIAPPVRLNLGFILVQPKENVNIDKLLKEINRETGLQALTAGELSWSSTIWVIRHVGVLTALAVICFLGFVVGVAVSGQTFLAFINENLPNIGALKAMGITASLLRQMLILQAAVVGFVGFGVGMLFIDIFVFSLLLFYEFVPINFPYFFYIPFFLSWKIIAATFFVILIICIVTALLGIVRVNTFQPAEVFRA